MTEKRYKILILPAVNPNPPSDGGKLCVYGFIDYLRTFHDIHLLLTATSEDDVININNLNNLWPEVTISYVNEFSPVRKKSSISGLLSIARKVRRQLFKQKISERNDPYSWYEVFRTMPFYPHSISYIGLLLDILSTNKFDIIQTELTGMLNLVHIMPPESKKIFVQIENRNDVLKDYGDSNNILKGYSNYVVKNTEFLELAYMAKYDAIFTLNETDRIRWQNGLPNVKIFNSPFGILNRDIKESESDSFVVENLLFMGSEGHYPNVDGLNWFLSDIIPLFKKRPFKKIYITGTWSNATKTKLKDLESSLEFIGFVDDLGPYLKNSISIVPIRLGGGGIRTKILSSMAQCSPVIATSVSSIGISLNNEKELIVADTAEEFANGISLLADNLNFTRRIISNAFDLINSKFSQRFVSEKRNGYYHQILLDKVE